MHQGGGVDHLDYGAQPHHAAAVIAERFCRQQQQGRADAFAPAFAQVVGDVGDGPHIGDGVAHQLGLDGAQVVAQQVEDFLCRRYRLCAHSVSRCLSDFGKAGPALRGKIALVRPVIGELHVNAEVVALKQCNRLL